MVPSVAWTVPVNVPVASHPEGAQGYRLGQIESGGRPEIADIRRDRHHAIVSLMEELEAAEGSGLRAEACQDQELRSLLEQGRDEGVLSGIHELPRQLRSRLCIQPPGVRGRNTTHVEQPVNPPAAATPKWKPGVVAPRPGI